MLGLIVMAIFTANVTTALTAVSLELTPSSLAGVKVSIDAERAIITYIIRLL